MINLDEFRSTVNPYSMTGISRIDCLYKSLEYVRTNNIQGDYVECGVWKGGNILGIMKYLESIGNLNPNIWLYDTFSGMTPPEENDKDYLNRQAAAIFDDVKCESSLEEVKQVLSQSNYPKNKVNLIVGDVCQSLLDIRNVPDKIALLRLDTDWYASTKIELEVLWDRLEVGAPCIIDDYGHWLGCREAVDEFFFKLPCHHNLEMVDYTCGITYKKC